MMRQKLYGIFVTAAALALVGAIGISTLEGAWMAAGASSSGANGPTVYISGDFIGVNGLEKEYQISSLEEAPGLAGEILGIYNAENEFSGKSVEHYGNDSFYRLSQSWEGYPVWGRGASLLADGSGNIYAASSNYVRPENVMAEQDVSEEDCLALAEDYVRNTLGAEESSEIYTAPAPDDPLVVCLSDDDSTGWLCRQILVSFSDSSDAPVNYTLLLSVSDGSVQKAETGVHGAQAFGEFDTLPETATVEADGDTIIFSDTSRNIDVYNANDEAVVTQAWGKDDATTYRFTGYKFYTKDGKPLQIAQSPKDIAANLPSTLGGLTVLHTAEGVFDYFAERCQRFGPNGYGGKYSLIYNCKYREGSERPFAGLGSNAGYTSAGAQLPYYWTCLYSDFDLSSYEDLGHEYTHTILSSFFKAGESSHSKALLEAYCDIFGILAGVYATGDEPDWENSYRDLLPDSDSIGSDGKTGSFDMIQYYDYDKYIHDPDYAGYDYQGCTIAGYATALLWENWRESMSREEALQNMTELIWTSLFYLQDYPSYEDFAWAFYASASRLDLTEEQHDAVRKALQQVNLPTDWSDGHATKMELSEIDASYSSELLEACAAVIESGDTELTRVNEEYTALRLLRHNRARIILDSIQPGAEFNDGTFVWKDAHFDDLGKYFWSIYGTGDLISLDHLRYFIEYDDGYTAEYPMFTAESSRWSMEMEEPEMDLQTIHLRGTVTSPQKNQYDFYARLERLGEKSEGMFFDGYVLKELNISALNTDGTENEKNSTGVSLLLKGELAELVSQYGVIGTGSEDYTGTGYGGGETLVPAKQVTGLLGADIYDYDGDGQDELLTVRCEPAKEYDTGESTGGWIETKLYLTVYEQTAGDSGGSVVPADEKTISVPGLPDTLCSSSIQFMRGVQDGKTALYLDYYFNFNTQSFSTIRLTYDGKLNVSGGVDCSEFAFTASCDTGASEGALETMGGRQSGSGGSRQGWETGEVYNWEGQSAEIPGDYFESYRNDWQKGMEAIGLQDSSFRTMYTYAIPVVHEDNAARTQYYIDLCTRRPAETCAMTGGGMLTELCGILSPSWRDDSGMYKITFTCYDSTGLLDQYRGGGAGSGSSDGSSGTDSGSGETSASSDSPAMNPASSGMESPDDLFAAFSTAFLQHQDSGEIAALYGLESEADRSAIEAVWTNRLAEITYNGSMGISSQSFAGAQMLSDEEAADLCSAYPAPPEAACLLHIDSTPDWSEIWPDWMAGGIELYAARYDGNWYLIPAGIR